MSLHRIYTVAAVAAAAKRQIQMQINSSSPALISLFCFFILLSEQTEIYNSLSLFNFSTDKRFADGQSESWSQNSQAY